jgi:UMF1 family MFS transporter
MGSMPSRHPPKLAVASWILYDLANTIFSMNIVSWYFTLWIVNVMGGTDADYGFTTGISMAVIFLASPFLGAFSDQFPKRMPFLVVSTVICVAFTLPLGSGSLAASLAFFVVANIAYQAGLQFYDSLLPEVSTPRNRGWIGGVGVAVGYMGSFIGLGLGFCLLRGSEGLPAAEQSARYARVFQATAVVFLLFAVPCFLFVRERAIRRIRSGAFTGAAAFRQVAETVRNGRKHPGLIRFLLGRMFYTDAINTLIAFMGIYVTAEIGYSTVQAGLVMMVATTFAMIGGFVWGRVADSIGPKRTLDAVLVLWMADFAWIAAVGHFRLPQGAFAAAPALAGFCLGGTWAADRPLMLRLTPPGRVGEFYGLYGMAGRFSAITGPFLWGFVVTTLGLGRPVAVLSLLCLVFTGWLVLRPVQDGTGKGRTA